MSADPAERQRLEEEEFYVGYFPTPPRLLRFSWIGAVVGLFLLVGLGLAIAATQRAPSANLEPYQPGRSLVGVVVDKPYPHLRVLREDGDLETVLFVGGAKHDASVAEEQIGRMVRVSGNVLERSGTRMLEGPGGFEPVEEAPADDVRRLVEAPTDELGRVALRGEIVDSKCFFGRMKPGEGRAHRACAQLCIGGGVPPLLVTRDESGRETYYILATSSGEAANDEVLPFVAEPVEVKGRLERRAGMFILSVDSREIHRL